MMRMFSKLKVNLVVSKWSILFRLIYGHFTLLVVGMCNRDCLGLNKPQRL